MIGLVLLAGALALQPPQSTQPRSTEIADSSSARLATVEKLTGVPLPGEPWYNHYTPPPLQPLPWYLRLPILDGSGCSSTARSVHCTVKIYTKNGSIRGSSHISIPR